MKMNLLICSTWDETDLPWNGYEPYALKTREHATLVVVLTKLFKFPVSSASSVITISVQFNF